ncbi:MAG: hypothetical protein HY784_19300, partial [Chloroflexi bacterium]|nr:hypothetical protein [Chloroflexota bacterium]
VLGLPIFDTTLVTLSRLRRRVSIAQGGSDHTSHRLARLGLSHRRVVIALYTVGAALGALAALMTQSSPLYANALLGGLGVLAAFLLWLLEEIQRQPETSRLKMDLRVTLIGGGEALLPLLEGAAAISRSVTVLVTPAAAEEQWTLPRLLGSLAILAEHPDAVRAVLQGAPSFGERGSLAEQVTLAQAALRLRGHVVLTTVPSVVDVAVVSEAAQEAIQHTDLIVIGGDLRENVLPTLRLPEVARALRRSKRARVLAHPDPRRALAEIEQAAGPDLITHVLASADWEVTDARGATIDLRQGGQVADALEQIWLARTRVRGAPPPVARSVHG